MSRFDLRKLILLLAVVSALLTFLNSFFASYQTQRDQLMEHTLEANRAYAVKLANITQNFFVEQQKQLAYSARELVRVLDEPTARDAITARLSAQSSSFNAVLVVDAEGTVLAASDDLVQLIGQHLDSTGAQLMQAARRPLITPPYIGATGELLVMIAHPLFDAYDRYLGFVGGAIYLQQPNILHTLLGEHYHHDGSYLYVVDGDGRLIYHPNRVGQIVTSNPVVQAAISHEAGARRVVNTQGVDMLAGYAYAAAPDWGVIAQRPTEETLSELDTLGWKTVRNAIPFTLPSLLLFWWLARLIATPLRQLATTAERLDDPDAPSSIRSVNGWYYEADRLKLALLEGVGLLQQKLGRLSQENVTDPLTGLANRRGLQLALQAWQDQGRPFAVAALDIDHFKQINDRFGHDTGDKVLQMLAQLMRESSRSSDLLCRSGGEEFLLLLPDAGQAEALVIAERLRMRVSLSPDPTARGFTVSLGVAHFPTHGTTPEAVLKKADQALYAAKQGGRNRVMGADDLHPEATVLPH